MQQDLDPPLIEEVRDLLHEDSRGAARNPVSLVAVKNCGVEYGETGFLGLLGVKKGYVRSTSKLNGTKYTAKYRFQVFVNKCC
ncbi:hypothetical protein [Calothrix sp. PCC 6303]|uniref:hypothetical protein n=1 Tax=Calothrix sp. PCC 6303 TaxID=1170562 RepID=UPI0005A1ED62|nr:hypothetical protein [Calothrix sp. PCC 6303]